MSLGLYEKQRQMAGGLKMRATAGLADGRSEHVFEACVLFHEAARVEQRAVGLIDAAPAETRLAALIEACACYVDGLDPPMAGQVWAQIVRERERVDAEVATSMLSRLEPRYERSHRAYAKLLSKLVFIRPGPGGSLVPPHARDRRGAAREVAEVTDSYPGAAIWWWAAYRIAEASGRNMHAWYALRRAHRLEPDNARFEAVSLLAATWALAPAAADEHLAGYRGRLDGTAPEVCLMYALGEVRLARDGPPQGRVERWERALQAARAGLAQHPGGTTRKNLRATELLIQSYLDDEKPTLELLYLAGLADVAVRARPTDDIADLVTTSAKEAA